MSCVLSLSALSIVPIKEEHNGQWNCLLVSVNGNKSKAVSVIVISEHTRYCPLAGNGIEIEGIESSSVKKSLIT